MDVERDTHSIQISEDRHVYIDEPGILFNHSCEPNLRIYPFEDGRCNFYAIQDIEIGEELAWHYGMTEAYSIAVKECKCGAPSCFGKSVGFKEAPLSIQKNIYDWGCADYLKDWFEQKMDQTKSKLLQQV